MSTLTHIATVFVLALVISGCDGGSDAFGPYSEGAAGSISSNGLALDAVLGDPVTALVEGAGWQADGQVILRVVHEGDPDPLIHSPLPGGVVNVGPDGAFWVPIPYAPSMPAGPDWLLVAEDPATGRVAATEWPWLAQPVPTPVVPALP